MLVKLHLKATDLKKMDAISGKSDPYFTVMVAGSDDVIFKSAVVEKSLDPEWEEVEFEVPDEFQTKVVKLLCRFLTRTSFRRMKFRLRR